ncbi:MAG: glutathione S-transferase, partial [Nitrospira sp.]|nr:glutathione S-transferase [Nitrospira sp.]
MAVPVISAFYGGLLGVLAIVLAVLVINQRRITHIGIGDGGNK